MPAAVELRPTIDRGWLEKASTADPVAHAYAVWDLDHLPEKTRFVSAVSESGTEGYLLLWLGHPTAPIVHWVGGERFAQEMANGLPPRPFVAIVPPEVRDRVVAHRGPAAEYDLLLLERPKQKARTADLDPSVRRLQGADRPTVASWAAEQRSTGVSVYRWVDPDQEAVWGAIGADGPIGVVRASVRLPAVWILSGLYVQPGDRGAGWGRRLVDALVAAADSEGASVALYVRGDRTDARRVYESAGFRTVASRCWVDAGAGVAP